MLPIIALIEAILSNLENERLLALNSFIFRKIKMIKRKNGLDSFNVISSSYVCCSHFKAQDILKAAGGTRCTLRKGAKPSLHSWNNFKASENERKSPGYRQSPQKSIVLPDNDVLNKTSSSSNRDPLLYRN